MEIKLIQKKEEIKQHKYLQANGEHTGMKTRYLRYVDSLIIFQMIAIILTRQCFIAPLQEGAVVEPF